VDLAGVAAELSRLTGDSCAAAPAGRVHGGSINSAYRWPTAAAPLFVKVGAPGALAMFEAEAAGLAELARARALRVPAVRACGASAAAAFLALEWIESGVGGEACEARLGAGLAAQHAVTAHEFGWQRDNTIGSTAQVNTPSRDWTEFFWSRRLAPQLELARARGLAAELGAHAERLPEALPALLAGHRPAASLLHGDLWGGNWLCAASGEPVLVDPAVYYGDREADLAMTSLFGGFGAAFYRAYQAAAPLAHGWQARATLYNLYHVLNHANLFGGGYARQARAMIGALLALTRG
jgi:fructosamine-3-kinase